MQAKVYPMWAERAVLLSGVILALIAGKWIWQQDLAVWMQWGLSICVLPIMVLMLTELAGRILQGSH